MKKLYGLIGGLLVAVLLATPVLAVSDISGALYRGTITIGNDGTDATNVATVCTISTANLIAGGFLNAGATNCAMRNAAGADVAFMPGQGANPWVMSVPSIGASEYTNYTLYTADSLNGSIRYFPGAGGMTTLDSATLEPGANFEIEVSARFDTSSVLTIGGKSGAIVFDVPVAGQIKAADPGAPLADVQAACASGEHIVKVTDNGANRKLYIDGVEVDSGNSHSVVDNANNWVWFASAATPYINYLKITIAGVLQQHIVWENAATFNDLSAGNHDATPTFRTTSSDADVTGTMTAFLPISEAKAPAGVLATPSDWITAPAIPGTFTDTVTSTFPGADIIDDLATAGTTPTPSQLPTLLISGFIALMISFSLSYAMRKNGASSLFIKMLIYIAAIGVGIATSTYNYWMAIFFVLIAWALAMGSQQRGWN